MSARAAGLIAGDRGRWPLAGDQLYVDLVLSGANLPSGMRLAIGSAIVEVTDLPHLGCGKFAERYGVEAREFQLARCRRAEHARHQHPGRPGRHGSSWRRRPQPRLELALSVWSAGSGRPPGAKTGVLPLNQQFSRRAPNFCTHSPEHAERSGA